MDVRAKSARAFVGRTGTHVQSSLTLSRTLTEIRTGMDMDTDILYAVGRSHEVAPVVLL